MRYNWAVVASPRSTGRDDRDRRGSLADGGTEEGVRRLRTQGAARMTDTSTSDTRTDETVELLQQMIRNRCVNDGTAESGHETRNADLLRSFLGSTGPRPAALRADAGSRLAGGAHRGQRPDGAEPVPDGPHRRRAGQRERLVARSVRRRADRRRGVGPRRGRHAQPHRVDGRRLPPPRHHRVPPARRPDLLRRRRRGVGQRARHAVDGRPRARRDPRRLRADRERRSAQRAEGATRTSRSTSARRASPGAGCACAARRVTARRRSRPTTR